MYTGPIAFIEFTQVYSSQ